MRLRPKTLAVLLLALGLMAGCRKGEEMKQQELPGPPVARMEPHKLEAHGHLRTDDYYWLNGRDTPEVMAYLEAENEYTTGMTAHTAGLQEQIFNEIKGRIKQTDATVPYREGDHFYYTRYEEELQYAIYCRRKDSLEAPEEVILDVNRLAQGHEFFSLGDEEMSPGEDILAFTADTEGRRFYTINFIDLETGEALPDKIPDVTSRIKWANDNRTLFYLRQDPETLREFQVCRHRLGTDPADDVLVYEERDETFSCRLYKSKSQQFIFIESEQTVSTEFRFLDADTPEGEFTIFAPRRRGHEYDIDHAGGHFYIHTNREAKNFRLMRTAVENTGESHWEEVVGHREEVLLDGFELFSNFVVLSERHHGLTRFQILPLSGAPGHYIDFDEPAYDVYTLDNYESQSTVLRFGFESMATPASIFDYDLGTRKRTLLKQDEILGGYDPAAYRTERLFARAKDGTGIPISLVYRRDLRTEGGNPLLLYGYGSYGYSLDAGFSAERVSLLDRGFIYAIAHVRGGEELGRQWYEDGKLFNKKNTFTDFIACAEHLAAEGYAARGRLYARGGSAGGLLISAVINMRPDLFHGVIADVPFVDVMTTMLDDTIPLTTGEYDEWGDPNRKNCYDYMLSYSPYDNVAAQDYPHILVTTAYQDSQVQYWEPAKWVARLRAMKTDENRLLLLTRMDAGHGGTSGRFKRYREKAFDYAFLLDLARMDK